VGDIVKKYLEALAALDRLQHSHEVACGVQDEFIRRHKLPNRETTAQQHATQQEQQALQQRPLTAVPAAPHQPLTSPPNLGLPSLDRFQQRQATADLGVDPTAGHYIPTVMSPGLTGANNLFHNLESSWMPRDLGNADGGVESQVEMIGGRRGELFPEEVGQLQLGPKGEHPFLCFGGSG
jgi:hypothetical protein